jgi:hypothetical protein
LGRKKGTLRSFALKKGLMSAQKHFINPYLQLAISD